jgi:hypothetical protein
MVDIVISYKSERRKAAAHVAKILKGYGYTVWYDYSLVKGRDFATQIDAEIRAAKAVAVLWCTMSVGSEWVLDEAALAVDLGILVPVKIEPCELRVDFRRKDYVDLTGWTGSPRDHTLDALLDAVKQKVGRSPQPAYDTMREYEDIWRSLGAPSLTSVALEEPVQAEREPRVLDPALTSMHAAIAAERDWERFKIAETDNVEIIKAFVEQYKNSAPLWATRARQRLQMLALSGRRDAFLLCYLDGATNQLPERLTKRLVEVQGTFSKISKEAFFKISKEEYRKTGPVRASQTTITHTSTLAVSAAAFRGHLDVCFKLPPRESLSQPLAAG